jgi:hypothetical protein
MDPTPIIPPTTPQAKSEKRSWIILLLLVAFVSGVIGYWLGVPGLTHPLYHEFVISPTFLPTPTQTSVAASLPPSHPTSVEPSLVVNSNAEKALDEAIGSPVSSWKTYTSPRFTVSYPPTWSVKKQLFDSGINNTESIIITDMKDSESIQPGLYGHIGIFIDIYSGAMPKEGGWENGATTNPTIRAYTVNGYQGTWGEQDEEPNGKTENVLLANPNGGYAQIMLPNPMPPLTAETPMYVVFSEVLSTFHFVRK